MQSFPPEEAWLAIVPSLVGFFVCGGLFIVTLRWGRKRAVDYLFAAICFMGAIINADLSVINLLPDEKIALQVDRLTYVLFVFGPAVYIHFVHAFLEIKGRRWLELTAYFLGGAFLVLTFSGQFITGFHYYTFGRIAKGGIWYRLFTAFCAVTVIYLLTQLCLSMKGRNNVERNRIKYVISGLGLASVLLTLNIVPTYGYDVYPVGSFSFLPAIILAFGVLKYDLLDIGAVVRKGFTYSVLTVSLAVIYIGIAAMINLIIFTVPSLKKSLLPPLLSALLMVVVFDPVKLMVQNLINRIFYRSHVDYEAAIEQASAKLTTLQSEGEICHFITAWMEEVLQVEKAQIYIRQDDSYRAFSFNGGISSVPLGHPLLAFFRAERSPLHAYQVERLTLEDEKKTIIREFFTSTSAFLSVPVLSHDELVAFFLLGEKKSGEVFLREEMGLLLTLAHQTAIALENARAFSELKAWNERLEQKVAERTRELSQALREKELAQKQMIRSESLAAIGELVAGTAHELNNPISSAMSLLQTSLEEIETYEKDEKLKELMDDLEFARKELKRAADIVRSLLDVSRQTTHYLEEVNLTHVIEDALRVLHNIIKKMDVQIHRDFSPNLPKIMGNFAELGQIFINIIKNALQALPEGKGELFLSVHGERESDYITVECADTGCGIPDELKESVFKPFFTTKEVGKGTGLGLYISHELTRRHNGNIDILDRPGGGTIVRVKLPVRR